MPEEKNKGEKKSRLFFDLIIAGLILVVLILVDLFAISLKSAPADLLGVGNANNSNQQITEEDFTEFQQITEDIVFIPILNFHHIDQAPAGAGNITKTYYIEPDLFESIIIDLIAADYEFVFVSEIIDFIKQGQLPAKQILAITFDDGNKNFYTPLLIF